MGISVLSKGIEPLFSASEANVLSVERREQMIVDTVAQSVWFGNKRDWACVERLTDTLCRPNLSLDLHPIFS